MPISNPIVCGSISARPSPLGVAMHNAAYRALGLPYTYVAFGVEDTEKAVLAARYLGFRGLGVSMPHKIAIMPFLDAVDETAGSIGAVNTVVNDDGRLTGYNTDWTGATRALEEKIDLTGKRAVVIGAGGAARAIVYGLVRSKSRVTIYNKTASKGKALARDFGATFGGTLEELGALGAPGAYDVLVNATSVGFHAPDATVVPPDVLLLGKVVLDVVFIPPETRLLKDAAARGCEAVAGTRMLIHQARSQFELYTGQQAPFAIMEKALMERISRM